MLGPAGCDDLDDKTKEEILLNGFKGFRMLDKSTGRWFEEGDWVMFDEGLYDPKDFGKTCCGCIAAMDATTAVVMIPDGRSLRVEYGDIAMINPSKMLADRARSE